MYPWENATHASKACDGDEQESGIDMEKKGARSGSRKIRKTSDISSKTEPAAATEYQNAGSSLSVTPTATMNPFSRSEPPNQVLTQKASTFSRRRASAAARPSYLNDLETSLLDGVQSSKTQAGSPSVKNDHGGEALLRCRDMTIPPCISEEHCNALLTATTIAPVTKESLEELDLMYIRSNINLRVDINYDHDLHFMPVSGQKAEQKRLEARKYWLSLAAELRILHHYNFPSSCSECSARSSEGLSTQPQFTPRLPQLFCNLKELLTILVPDRDQDQIAQYLDIPLLVQEVSHGLLDVVKLARWLCDLLTTHCAPMRDISAQEMSEKVKEGAETGDMLALVEGIEKLFTFLEAMKLDVANHQIRSFRYPLIEDTVAFQQEFFSGRIRNNNLNVESQKQWFARAVTSHQSCGVDGILPKGSPMGSFLHALVSICVSVDPEFPETLKYDTIRLRAMRDEIQDIIHLDICLSVFDRQIRRLVGRDCNPSAMHSLLQARIMTGHLTVQNRIMDLTDGHMAPNLTVAEMWSQHGKEIALELTNAAFGCCKRTRTSIPDSEITDTTRQLLAEFDDEKKHGRRAQLLSEALERSTQGHARTFQSMTALDISEKQKQWHHLRQQNQQGPIMPVVEDMARKLAHMAVIHMRVWEDIVYLPGRDRHGNGVDGSGESMDSDQFGLLEASSDAVYDGDTLSGAMELSED